MSYERFTQNKRREQRREFIRGLRAVARFLEQNPDFHVPRKRYTLNFLFADESQIANHARMMGSCKKSFNYTQIGLVKDFGLHVALKVNWPHYKACRRVRVEGETETEWDREGPLVKRERPKYKWVCPTSFLTACCGDG